jgi:hypothetical protein
MKTILMAWELGGGHLMRLRPLAQTLIEAGVPGSADPLKSLRLALLVIAGLMTVAACSAMSSGPDPQAACRIGAVSPEEYRTIGAEIAAQPPID